jgi:hypothetical protein
VEFSGAVPTKVGKGSTTIPTLKIVSWIDRPSELDDDGETGALPSSIAQPAASADDEF